MSENTLPPTSGQDQPAAPALTPAARAAWCDQAVQELEMAVRHLQTAARHFRDGEIPRGCAHVFAAQGHQRNAQAALEDLAVFHAAHSLP